MSPTGDQAVSKGGGGRLLGVRESNQALAELKTKLEFALSRLNDQDTQRTGVEEIREFLQTLYADWFPVVISCISEAGTNLKPLGRCESVKLLGLLAELHGKLVVPLLPRILQVVVGRMQDADLHLREACVETVFRLTRALVVDADCLPIFATLLKPLFSALAEHSKWVQIGAAACICSVIQGSPAPVIQENLGRLCSRLVQHLSLPLAMAKPQLLNACIYVMQAVGGGEFDEVLPSLMPCLESCLNASSDWQTRKQAIEVLQTIGDDLEMGQSLDLPVPQSHRSGKPTPLQRRISTLLETVRGDKVRAVREAAKDVMARWCITRAAPPAQGPSAAARAASPSGSSAWPDREPGASRSGGAATTPSSGTRASSPPGNGSTSWLDREQPRGGAGSGAGGDASGRQARSPKPLGRDRGVSGALGMSEEDSFGSVAATALAPDRPRGSGSEAADAAEKGRPGRKQAVRAALSGAALSGTTKLKPKPDRQSIFAGPQNANFFNAKPQAATLDDPDRDAADGEALQEYCGNDPLLVDSQFEGRGAESDTFEDVPRDSESNEAMWPDEAALEEQLASEGTQEQAVSCGPSRGSGSAWVHPDDRPIRPQAAAGPDERPARPPPQDFEERSMRPSSHDLAERPIKPMRDPMAVYTAAEDEFESTQVEGSREPLTYSDDDDLSPSSRLASSARGDPRDARGVRGSSSPFNLSDQGEGGESSSAADGRFANDRELGPGPNGDARDVRATNSRVEAARAPGRAPPPELDEAWSEEGSAGRSPICRDASSGHPDRDMEAQVPDNSWPFDQPTPTARKQVSRPISHGSSRGLSSDAQEAHEFVREAQEAMALQLEALGEKMRALEEDRHETEEKLIARIHGLERTCQSQVDALEQLQHRVVEQERQLELQDQQIQVQQKLLQRQEQVINQQEQLLQQHEEALTVQDGRSRQHGQQLEQHEQQMTQLDQQVQQAEQQLDHQEQQLEEHKMLMNEIVASSHQLRNSHVDDLEDWEDDGGHGDAAVEDDELDPDMVTERGHPYDVDDGDDLDESADGPLPEAEADECSDDGRPSIEPSTGRTASTDGHRRPLASAWTESFDSRGRVGDRIRDAGRNSNGELASGSATSSARDGFSRSPVPSMDGFPVGPPKSQQRKAELLWGRVVELCDARRYLEAYKQVIAEPEEYCLLRLMEHTGPVVERLDAESNSRLIRRLIHILSSPTREPSGPCVQQIFAWLRQALDVSIHFTASQVEDLIVALQRISSSGLAESGESGPLISRLSSLRRP